MALRWLVRPNTYHDSVKLMRVSETLARAAGVTRAAVVMATPLNLDLLADDGLLPEVNVSPEDLLVAVQAEDEASADAALASLDSLLTARPPAAEESPGGLSEPLHTLEQALKRGEANLAVIAVPGAYAAAEAYAALRAGLHVFLFSDNVSLEDEVRLKRLAAERDLLMMGPDCGTAILGGVGLGFANRVLPGPVGIVGASGTGIQHLCSLLDLAGIGVAHAVGTGGRDLSAAVGGSMTRRTLWTLEADPQVQVIAVISKPADADVTRRLHQELVSLSKPAVVCLLGATPGDAGPVRYVETLTDAFLAIAQGLGVSTRGALKSVRVRSKPRGGRVYGLFTGGTLCSEAARVLDGLSVPHHLIDLGEDEYTRGRAHPIIDPRLRTSMLERLREREDVGVVLLDVVLGDLAHPDPASVLLPAVERLRAGTKGPSVVAVLIGTRQDPQGLDRQWAALEEAGVQVFASNARAAAAAGALVGVAP